MRNLNSSNRPSVGDLKHDLGIWFRYTGEYWVPDEILGNVICKKNAGHTKYYNGNPNKHVTGSVSFSSKLDR
jgi:hypothetical protein